MQKIVIVAPILLMTGSPPRFSFGTALAIIISGALILRVLLDACPLCSRHGSKRGSTPGAAAGLAIVISAPLLNALFARQLWRWSHRKICGARSAGFPGGGFSATVVWGPVRT